MRIYMIGGLFLSIKFMKEKYPLIGSNTSLVSPELNRTAGIGAIFHFLMFIATSINIY